MAVVRTGCIAYLLWVISSAAWAEEDPTFINKQQEDEIINLAYMQMRASIEELERKIDECRVLEKKTTLDPALFESLNLTKAETLATLSYFRSYAEDKCEGLELWAKIGREFARFKHVEFFYKGKNIIETDGYLDDICCMSATSHFETKWRYLQTPLKIREKLERIPELQKPFNAIKTAKKMSLFE